MNNRDSPSKKANTNPAILDPGTTLSEHLSALRKEMEDLIQHVVLTKLEAMERSLTDLWNQNKRLIRTLQQHGINHKTCDELEVDDSSGKSMLIDTKESVTLHSPSIDRELLRQVHPERVRNISDTSVPSKNFTPPKRDRIAATGMKN